MMAETISGLVCFRIRTRVLRRLFKNPVIEPKMRMRSGPIDPSTYAELVPANRPRTKRPKNHRMAMAGSRIASVRMIACRSATLRVAGVETAAGHGGEDEDQRNRYLEDRGEDGPPEDEIGAAHREARLIQDRSEGEGERRQEDEDPVDRAAQDEVKRRQPEFDAGHQRDCERDGDESRQGQAGVDRRRLVLSGRQEPYESRTEPEQGEGRKE